jgi:hypothetical protein
MPTHASLTGADLHEPKGAASASANQVYIANGSGSGTWSKVTASAMDTTTVKNVNKFFTSGYYDRPDAATTRHYPAPVAATLSKVTLVTTNAAVSIADIVLEFEKTSGGLDLHGTTSTVTIANLTAVGTVFTFTPNQNNTFAAGDTFRIKNVSGGSGAGPLVNLVFEWAMT